jgi:hypothetical protein
MARASTTTLSTGDVTLFNATTGWPGASGSDGSPVRSIDVRCLSGLAGFRIPSIHGTAYMTLSSGDGVIPLIAPPGQYLEKLIGKGISAACKVRFAATGV